jgi:hypothetical protein
MQQIRKRLSYANVMSTLAVFLVLGGGAAYAAKKIGSHELRGGAVTTAKIKRAAVTTAKIRNGAVKTAKIAPGNVTNGKLATGSITTEKLAPGFVAPAAEKLSHSAHISSSGAVLLGSQGIAQANVSHEFMGFYCFSGFNPAPVGGEATVDYSESGENVEIELGMGQGSLCPAGTQAFVSTRRPISFKVKDSTESIESGFFLLLY